MLPIFGKKLTIGRPFEIPADYGAILLVYTFHGCIEIYHHILVMKAREKYGVEYPNLYAPPGHKDKEKFDSIQRAHQNLLECLPMHATMMSLVGLYLPRCAAFCGTMWGIGRLIYGIGYSKYGPSGRRYGGPIMFIFGTIPLFGMLGVLGVAALTSGTTSSGKSEL